MSYHFVGIDHVQLAAPQGCEEQARKFYEGILGMTEIAKPEKLQARGGVWFQCGRHQVHIGMQDDFHAAKKAHPAFEVQGLAGLRARLEQYGVKVKDDDALEGAVRFFVDDPFGNRIELLEWLK
ncbi:VOC family protein [Paenibacillus sedimenti]|uniref:VOC family protein n=1 Tax=Paenibacillus sedimenti TaxID=2770274 RepID=A0A926QJV2_9BACL|nr:VOC family protein [Paenibacillus sedimenti]MBD0382121.1 VOC family protein [Paenibacillus sedimenti]